MTRIMGTLRGDPYTFLVIFYSIILRIRNTSDQPCRGKQNTHFGFGNFFRKSCHFFRYVEKYCRTGQATDDNIVHEHAG